MSTIAATNLKNASSGSNNIVLNADGTTTIAAPSNIIKSGTAVASTSGASIDFTGIPSWVKRVTVMFNGVSTNGTSPYLIRLGTSGGIESTGYTTQVSFGSAGGQSLADTTGFVLCTSGQIAAANTAHGSMVFTQVSGNTWVGQGVIYQTATIAAMAAGSKALSGTLDRVRITTVNGTDAFDAGSINILYEG